MAKYEGLPEPLRREVDARDGHRCRWCGATNRGRDIHHIRYRKGVSYDVIDNLISLCRACHSFVHGTPRPNGQTIVKPVAQGVLQTLVLTPGATGDSLWRAKKRRWTLQNLCEHGATPQTCPYPHPRA